MNGDRPTCGPTKKLRFESERAALEEIARVTVRAMTGGRRNLVAELECGHRRYVHEDKRVGGTTPCVRCPRVAGNRVRRRITELGEVHLETAAYRCRACGDWHLTGKPWTDEIARTTW